MSLVVGLGISLAGGPVAGNLTGTAILLLGGLGLYLRLYSTAEDWDRRPPPNSPWRPGGGSGTFS